jgi:hypothetical protein
MGDLSRSPFMFRIGDCTRESSSALHTDGLAIKCHGLAHPLQEGLLVRGNHFRRRVVILAPCSQPSLCLFSIHWRDYDPV